MTYSVLNNQSCSNINAIRASEFTSYSIRFRHGNEIEKQISKLYDLLAYNHSQIKHFYDKCILNEKPLINLYNMYNLLSLNNNHLVRRFQKLLILNPTNLEYNDLMTYHLISSVNYSKAADLYKLYK